MFIKIWYGFFFSFGILKLGYFIDLELVCNFFDREEGEIFGEKVIFVLILFSFLEGYCIFNVGYK